MELAKGANKDKGHGKKKDVMLMRVPVSINTALAELELARTRLTRLEGLRTWMRLTGVCSALFGTVAAIVVWLAYPVNDGADPALGFLVVGLALGALLTVFSFVLDFDEVDEARAEVARRQATYNDALERKIAE